MKKIIILITIVAFAATAGLGALGIHTVYEADRHEIRALQNVAGAVVSEYPEAEEVMVSAAMDEDMKNLKRGESILGSYGYDDEKSLGREARKTIFIYMAVIVAFFLITLVLIYYIVIYTERKKGLREKHILDILDMCLSEDFSFTNDEKLMDSLGNPIFADLLGKLADSLKVKTDHLREEQDNTKVLVTDISHQLKTPISAMRACFDMYVEAENDEEREEFLARSRIQMDKLEELAHSLVNISRLENSMITLKREEVMLSDLIIGAVNTVYHKAAEKEILIETGDMEDMQLNMDRKWTVEAIANILENAVKYSLKGSRIEIRVNRFFSFVRIEIEDWGIGLEKEEYNRIFRRFYRGKSDVVRNEEGAGVGLYLSRKIFEEQGGTISVRGKTSLGKDSEGNSGSIFLIQLPV